MMEFCSDSQLKLLCQISNASSFQEIADLCFVLMGNPIFISDMSRTILAYSSEDIQDEDWQRTMVHGDLERSSYKQSDERNMVHVRSVQKRMPVLVEDDEMPYPRLVKVLLEEDQPIGIVVLAGILVPITDNHHYLLELVSSFIASRTSKERFRFTNSRRSVDNFLLKLLDGAVMTAEYVRKRLDILEWHCHENLYVMVLYVEDERNVSGKSIGKLVEMLSEIPHCRALYYNTAPLFIYSGKERITDWEREDTKLSKMFKEWGIKAGVSRCFSGLEQLREHHLQAEKSIWLACRLERRERFFTYDSLSVFHMLEVLSHYLPPRMFCHKKILDLETVDHPENTPLLITLQVYLENTKSLSKTADILYLHRNTVLYRIKKCKEVMDSDFEDNNEVFSFILSLRILEFERKTGAGKIPES